MDNLLTPANIKHFLPNVISSLAFLFWIGIFINFYISNWLRSVDENFAKFSLLERNLKLKKYLKENPVTEQKPPAISFFLRLDKVINYVFAGLFIVFFAGMVFSSS